MVLDFYTGQKEIGRLVESMERGKRIPSVSFVYLVLENMSLYFIENK